MFWLAIAAAITVRTAAHLPYSLTWWSFTFPVSTVVTGTSVLALTTHAGFLRYASVALYALLIAAWLTAATHHLQRAQWPAAPPVSRRSAGGRTPAG